jgi:hypothetical protein
MSLKFFTTHLILFVTCLRVRVRGDRLCQPWTRTLGHQFVYMWLVPRDATQWTRERALHQPAALSKNQD